MQQLYIDLNFEPGSDPSLQAKQITLVAVKGNTGISLEEAGLITADYWVTHEHNNGTPEKWGETYIGNVYTAP